MNCQKSIAEKIVGQSRDYLLHVKGNQPSSTAGVEFAAKEQDISYALGGIHTTRKDFRDNMTPFGYHAVGSERQVAGFRYLCP